MVDYLCQCNEQQIQELLEKFKCTKDEYDQILWKNFQNDASLNSEICQTESVRENIKHFFMRLLNHTHDSNGQQRTLCEAYKQVLDEDSRAQTLTTVEWTYTNLYLLGFPSRSGSQGKRRDLWVSFFSVKIEKQEDPSIEPSLLPFQEPRASAEGLLNNGLFPKRILWIAPNEAIEEFINDANRLSQNCYRFDELRDLLGLIWGCNPHYVIVGITLTIDYEDKLVRVPTCFDSNGFVMFRPASRAFIEENGCGHTCRINDPSARGADELVAWVGAGEPPSDPPSHVGARGTKRPNLGILTGKDGSPRYFRVQTTLDLSAYRTLRLQNEMQGS
jgi:hypothetical protein